jgi:hypothetical protein
MSVFTKYGDLMYGENNHLEKKWCDEDGKDYDKNKIEELFAEFYFQLVRTPDKKTLENKFDTLVRYCKYDRKTRYHKDDPKYQSIIFKKSFKKLLMKLTVHTRDIIDGKGEYSLSYMQLYVWYKYFPNIGIELLRLFVEIDEDNKIHPYGSWKDIKYLCQYIYERDVGENKFNVYESNGQMNGLVKYAIKLICNRLKRDVELEGQNKSISLASKWCPREGSKYKWLHKLIVRNYYSLPSTEYNNLEEGERNKIIGKNYRNFRLMITRLNKYLDTTQIKMCDGRWSEINFNTVSSITMNKNKNSFNNESKMKAKFIEDEDRIECKENYIEFIEKAKDVSNTDVVVKGKRLNVYEMVSSAICAYDTTDIDLVNLQWKDHSSKNGPLPNMIVLSDTSASMSCNNNEPMYSSIGLGIRISELTTPLFRNKIMTFNDNPSWTEFNDSQTFVDKVKYLKQSHPWGGNTNFYKAFKLILNVLVGEEVPPSEVEDMTLVILSDMQINSASYDNTDIMYDKMRELYAEAGMKTKYKEPYILPHILFWNLRSTNGFPSSTSNKNVTMFSGYSSSLLNAFCEKGIDVLKDMTPINMIIEILNKERYSYV